MKKKLPIILLIFAFLIGISLIAYPTVSNWWNQAHMSRVASVYGEKIEEFTPEDLESIRQDAKDYNKTLIGNSNRFNFSKDDEKIYNSLLNISGDGVMGVVDIPVIDTKLPIYHGTSEGVLQVAVGHLEGSSLPVGGESTHTVITSHTGLPSAKLFTKLDRLKEGDLFFLHVLNDTLAYKVDHIVVVEPDDFSYIEIEEGKDFATLVTCTPYGINTHRLLVRGHRVEIEEVEEDIPVIIDNRIDFRWIAAMVAAIVLVIFTVILVIRKRKKSKIK